METRVAVFAGTFGVMGALIGGLSEPVFNYFMVPKLSLYELYIETGNVERASTGDYITFTIAGNSQNLYSFSVNAEGRLLNSLQDGGEGIDILRFATTIGYPFIGMAIDMKNTTSGAEWNLKRAAIKPALGARGQPICFLFDNLWIGGNRSGSKRPSATPFLQVSTEKCDDIFND